MRAERRRTIRRQVPENDPALRAEQEQQRRTTTISTFGESALKQSRKDASAIERAQERIRGLQSQLDESEEGQEGRGRLLGAIDQEQRFIEFVERDRDTGLRRKVEHLLRDTERLRAHRHAEHAGRRYVESEVERMLQGEQFSVEIARLFGEEEPSLRDIQDRMRDGSVQYEALFEAVEGHVERIEAQREQFEAFVERTRREFKDAVERAVEEGRLPEQARASLHRIDELSVQLSDRLEEPLSFTMGENHGSQRRVDLDVAQYQGGEEARNRHILFHEFVHEISGRSIAMETETGEKNELTTIEYKKLGLRFFSEARKVRNEWINEAVTESLALELSGFSEVDAVYEYNGSSSYIQERVWLNSLYEGGLDRATVLAAYFENFSSDNERGENGKHYARLAKELDGLLQPGALSRLENTYRAQDAASSLRRFIRDLNSGEVARADNEALYKINIRIGSTEQVAAHESVLAILRPDEKVSSFGSDEQKIDRIRERLDAMSASRKGFMSYDITEI